MSNALPAELSAAPPRDPASAPHLFARGGGIVGAAFAAAALVPVVVVAGVLVLDPDAIVTAAILSGVVGLAFAAAGAGTSVQRSQARRLYRDGLVTTGRVAAVRRASSRNAYVFVDVEYADARGGRWSGSATMNAQNATLDFGVGHHVPVLYAPGEPRRFAIFSRALGLVPGLAKR